MSPISLAPPPLTAIPSAAPAAGIAPAAGPDFAALLAEAVGEVNANAAAADSISARALLGEDVTQAEVFTAVKKADLSLRMLISVRNKLLEGWKELQAMPV